MSTPTMRAPRSARWVAMALPIPAAAPVTIAICPSNCVLTVDLLLCRDGGLGRVRLRPAYDRPCRGAPAHRRRTTLTPPSSHRPHPPARPLHALSEPRAGRGAEHPKIR